MSTPGRRARPLPPSVPVYDELPWVDPAELAPPWWHRLASGIGLAAMVVILGVVLAVSVGIVLLGSFFVMDFLISQ